MKNKNNKTKWIIGIVLIVVAGFFIIFSLTRGETLKGEEVEVKSGDIKTYYSFSGNVEAKDRQTLFSQQTAQVKDFKVIVGDKVKEGDVLYETSTGTKVKSDIQGEIRNIFVQEDELLSPGAKIMEIVNYEALQLKVKVDEYDLTSIQEGTEVEVTIHSLDKKVPGKIQEIAKEGTYLNGVTFFDTTISLEKEEGILVGMSAEGKVLNEQAQNAPILPVKAISFKEDNSPYVKIKKDGELLEKDIKIGITDGVEAQIKEGLKVGDKVFIEEEATNNFGPPQGVQGSNEGEPGDTGGDS